LAPRARGPRQRLPRTEDAGGEEKRGCEREDERERLETGSHDAEAEPPPREGEEERYSAGREGVEEQVRDKRDQNGGEREGDRIREGEREAHGKKRARSKRSARSSPASS
jgi:hypothetical protein